MTHIRRIARRILGESYEFILANQMTAGLTRGGALSVISGSFIQFSLPPWTAKKKIREEGDFLSSIRWPFR